MGGGRGSHRGRHLFQGSRGNKGNILGGHGNKDITGEQGTQKNKFSILGEQGNKPIHFRGVCTPPPPVRASTFNG